MKTILRSIALLCLAAHVSAGELLTGEAAAAISGMFDNKFGEE